jgi:glycerate 2-kinase
VPSSSDLLRIIRAGIDAVKPAVILPPLFTNPPEELTFWIDSDRRFLISLGKASVDCARSVLQLRSCNDYFVISPFQDPKGQIRVHRGNHPIPANESYKSTLQLIEWLTQLSSEDSLLVLLSGGTSALCVLPLPSVSLESKMKVNQLLIRSGASIHEMNVVRKHLSAVKGGQLAKLTSHIRSIVLVISDVIGDDLSVIASGPFYPDPTTFSDAQRVLVQYELWDLIPFDAKTTIERGMNGEIAETPKPGDTNIPHRIIASNAIARNAAADEAERLGYSVDVIHEPLKADVETAADRIFGEIKNAAPGHALIFGGEVTVRVPGNGVGGRNQHLALLLSQRLQGMRAIFGAAGTDGIDGNSEAAGAWTDGETFARAGAEVFQIALTNSDSFHFFDRIGQTIQTGPTGTNVMDLYIGLT